MKIQLSKQFQKPDSPYKIYMDRQKKERKEINDRRFSLKSNIRNSVQIIDPLNEELEEYSNSIDKNRVIPKSKAYQKMKIYLNQQDRKLKHIRLQEIKQTKKNTSMMTQNESPEAQSQQFLTALSEVDSFFKNQMRDTMLYQNSILKKTIDDRLHSLNDTMQTMNYTQKRSTSLFDNQPEIDRTIALHRQRNRKIIAKFNQEKSELKQGNNSRKYRSLNQPLMMISRSKPIQKTKIRLEGLKSVQIRRQNQVKTVSPSIALLLEMKSLNQLKLRKEVQLDSLLRHEHQNRQQHILDKTHYYSQSVQLKTLNPSMQFSMRKIMNNKLLHRLKASKDQSVNFSEFMIHLRESRTIICNDLQQIFGIIRSAIKAGKTLRETDYNTILQRFDESEQLKLPANMVILKKVRNMMV